MNTLRLKNFVYRFAKCSWKERRFVVEVLTLIVVSIYTYQAYRLTVLTQSSLQVATRPYIQIIPFPKEATFHPTADKPLQMAVYLFNTGRLPTRTLNHSVVRYSSKRLPNPGLSDNGATRWVWGDSQAIIYPSPTSLENLSAADIANMKAGIGWVYVSVVSV